MRLAVLCAVAFVPHLAAAQPCAATAVLDGDGPLVDEVGSALALRGIATAPRAGCTAAKARVERDRAAIRVSVVDADGRRSERTLQDVDAAAALIASWAQQDVNASLLAGQALAPEPPPAPVPLSTSASITAVAPPPERAWGTVHAGVESSFTFDGEMWLGARATGCVRLGPVCAGATVRALSNTVTTYEDDIDALATVEVPLRLGGRAAIVLGAATGPGWFFGATARGEALTPITVVGLRGDAHASLAVRVAASVRLHLGVSVGVSPFASTVTDGDAGRVTDEPRGFVRADLGLRIGAP